MKLNFAFSTCPNDTFMFDAIINKKVDTEGIEFFPIYADIAKLNEWSLTAKYDITKISYNAFTFSSNNYFLLDSGSALGYNCGPILIKKNNTILNKDSKIGIPGKYTSIQGSSNCSDCIAGKYSIVSASDSKDNCLDSPSFIEFNNL